MINGNSFSLSLSPHFLSAGDQLTDIFALSVLRENIITSCQKDTGDLFESVPTLETRFAPLSHLPRATSRSLVSREQVEIKVPQRAGSLWMRSVGWRGENGQAVIQRTNGKVEENGTFYKRMSAQQCAQKALRHLIIGKRRCGCGQSFARLALCTME